MALFSAILAGLALSGLASAACTRDFLANVTNTYLSAQRAGSPSFLAPLTTGYPNFIYLENNKLTDLHTGTVASPLKIDAARSLHDPDQCAAFTELIAASDPVPHVIHTRFVFDPVQLQATLVESIVTKAGDWLFNATGTLALSANESWGPLPAAERASSRGAVQALGDDYFNRFGNDSVVVPWGPPCYRVEGGLAARGTLNGSDCEMVWPDTIIIPYRRYVVDVELGAVDLFIGFPGLDRTQGQAPAPDSHLFRVEGGKIKYVHTASSCVTAGCGLNDTTLGKRSGLKPVALEA